jgi:hypothetical protein
VAAAALWLGAGAGTRASAVEGTSVVERATSDCTTLTVSRHLVTFRKGQGKPDGQSVNRDTVEEQIEPP